MLVTTPVTILKSYDYAETSKILRCLTRDYGLRSLIAKGARRPRSRFGGLVEPFTDGIATFYLREGRDLHTLSAFELTRERQVLARDLVRFAGAGLLTELALRFAPEAADRQLFHRLRRGLDRLVAEPCDSVALVFREAWGVIGALGFRPSVARCVGCERALAESEGGSFDYRAGGIRCRRCQARAAQQRPLKEGGHAEVRLSARARAELAALTGRAQNGLSPLQTLREQRAVLRGFVVYHLADDRPLQSLRFLERHIA